MFEKKNKELLNVIQYNRDAKKKMHTRISLSITLPPSVSLTHSFSLFPTLYHSDFSNMNDDDVYV